jgi:hypothetical protein
MKNYWVSGHQQIITTGVEIIKRTKTIKYYRDVCHAEARPVPIISGSISVMILLTIQLLMKQKVSGWQNARVN